MASKLSHAKGLDISKISLAPGRKAKLGTISKRDCNFLEKNLSYPTLNNDQDTAPKVAAGAQSTFSKKKDAKHKHTSMALLSEYVEGDPLVAEEMKLAGRELESLPDLSICQALKRLDVSNNKLNCVDFLSNCRDITWLSIKDNQIQDISPIVKLWHLQLLNMGGNRIEVMDALHHMNELKVLIANNNALRSFDGLGILTNLSTLVLSHNVITEISGIKSLRQLTKLSVAHNQIRVIPDLSAHPLLEELRLNDNRIMRIPETMDRNPELRLLDLGRNRLFDITDLDKLSRCRKLQNVNLFGNAKLCEVAGYREKAIQCMPQVVIFDGRRVDESKAPKKKKAALDPSRSKKDPNKLVQSDALVADASAQHPPKGRQEEMQRTKQQGDKAGSASENTETDVKKDQEKKPANPATQAHNEFVKQEIRRLRAEDPSLDHRAAFKLAAAAWHRLGAAGSADGPSYAQHRSCELSDDGNRVVDVKKKGKKREEGKVGGKRAREAGQEGGKKKHADAEEEDDHGGAGDVEELGGSKGDKTPRGGKAQGTGRHGVGEGKGIAAAAGKRGVVVVGDGWDQPAAATARDLPAAAGRSAQRGGSGKERDVGPERSREEKDGGQDGGESAGEDAAAAGGAGPGNGSGAGGGSSGVVEIRVLPVGPLGGRGGAAGAAPPAKRRAVGGSGGGDGAAAVGHVMQVGLGGESAWD